ncbi:MAG: TMEM165/GDT1 family protein [Anaerolineae bacterium]|nr:TMEM165/GDT1 family protein [Anaerolineae bacterium]
MTTLGLVFVAELGDKTQLAVVTQTCKYRRPWPVFLGASLALALVSMIGALGGQLIARVIPPLALRIAAALAFVVMGLLIAREARSAARSAEGGACPYVPPGGACSGTSGWSWPAFGSSLGLLFVAELGDKTQLAILSLASKHATPWAVFAGGALALTLVTAIGVLGGEGLCRVIPERTVLAISAGAFVVMGILVGAGVL